MARPFAKVRGLMREHDYAQVDLADMLGVGERHVWAALNARRPWSLDEMYTIMDAFGVPHDQMHIYFPQGGQNEPGARRARKGA